MLCRRNALEDPAVGLADAWFALFAEGTLRLGNRFDQKSYLDYLIERHGKKGYLKGLSGLVLCSLLGKSTCFGPITVLSEEVSGGQTLYLRHAAPAERRSLSRLLSLSVSCLGHPIRWTQPTSH